MISSRAALESLDGIFEARKLWGAIIARINAFHTYVNDHQQLFLEDLSMLVLLKTDMDFDMVRYSQRPAGSETLEVADLMPRHVPRLIIHAEVHVPRQCGNAVHKGCRGK